MKKIFIHAPNINSGGGLVLLKDLINKFNKKKINYLVTLDSRLKNEEFTNQIQNKLFIRPSIKSRIFFEIKLIKIRKEYKSFLFFGNLSPLFLKFKNSYLFIQNRFLVDSLINLNNLSFKNRLRIFLERVWLNVSIHNVSKYLVQTDSMKKLLIQKFKINKKDILIRTFHSTISPSIKESKKISYDCLVVTSLDKHKNIDNLIKSLIFLSTDFKYFPSIKIIIGGKGDNKIKINHINSLVKKHSLKIIISQNKNHNFVMNQLTKSKSLLFISKLESLGLPLIEARSLNIPIIAPELDYVRDVVNPRETFDPNSPTSISRAIMRFFKIKHDLNTNIDILDLFSDD